MAYPEFHYRWTWKLRHTPAELWPYVADTNRFNHDTGLPCVDCHPLPKEESVNARRKLSFRRMGVLVEWTEEPFEWVAPRRFGVVRRYNRGPIERMRIVAELEPFAGGTRLFYQVWARPANLIGLLSIPIQIGRVSAKAFGRVFERYDDLIDEERTETRSQIHDFVPGGIRRLKRLREELVDAGGDENLISCLADVLTERPDVDVSKMRPYVFADEWDQPRRKVLDLFLLSTRLGLLDMSWDILCPLCRGTKESAQNLAGILPQVHCDTCNIDFEADFDRSVELTFRPGSTIREVGGTDYCVAGPRVTPHVVVQQLLAPGDSRTVEPELDEGRHRLRTLKLPGGRYVDVSDTGQRTLDVSGTADGWSQEDVAVNTRPALKLRNETVDEQLFILERVAWMDTAATAAEVTTLQRYRDLFSSEALRPGQRIAVGNLAILFTDLCDSTRMYREIGDAPAFGLVMEHFDILREAIACEGGGIVKTIGDAVMAAFREPGAALRAALRIQDTFARHEGFERPVSPKAGLHYGACIAVTLNDRLDYFGSAVNITSRLEHLSEGGIIVVSEDVIRDPEVQDLLDTSTEMLRIEPFTTDLKGFDDAFNLWRIGHRSADETEQATHRNESPRALPFASSTAPTPPFGQSRRY